MSDLKRAQEALALYGEATGYINHAEILDFVKQGVDTNQRGNHEKQTNIAIA